MRKKITIIGAGHVGATAAHLATLKELGDIVLVDVAEGLPQGIALDISETAPLEGFECRIIGTCDYRDTKGSDVVIISAGSPRKPGMSRDDLLYKNAEVVRTASEKAAGYSPNAHIIVVTNPLDAMAYVAMKASGFARSRVTGMAGVLDSARLRTFISMELGVSAKSINAIVLGGHGDSMLPLVRHSTVAGKPLTDLLPREKIEAIVERTRNAGGEILALMKTSSAYYSPAAAVVEMADAIIKDRKKTLCCSAYLDGEYGIRGCFLGVPVKLGASGVEEIIELKLTKEEKSRLHASAEEVKSLIKKLKI